MGRDSQRKTFYNLHLKYCITDALIDMQYCVSYSLLSRSFGAVYCTSSECVTPSSLWPSTASHGFIYTVCYNCMILLTTALAPVPPVHVTICWISSKVCKTKTTVKTDVWPVQGFLFPWQCLTLRKMKPMLLNCCVYELLKSFYHSKAPPLWS